MNNYKELKKRVEMLGQGKGGVLILRRDQDTYKGNDGNTYSLADVESKNSNIWEPLKAKYSSIIIDDI
jgi:hypothetical protein